MGADAKGHHLMLCRRLLRKLPVNLSFRQGRHRHSYGAPLPGAEAFGCEVRKDHHKPSTARRHFSRPEFGAVKSRNSVFWSGISARARLKFRNGEKYFENC